MAAVDAKIRIVSTITGPLAPLFLKFSGQSAEASRRSREYANRGLNELAAHFDGIAEGLNRAMLEIKKESEKQNPKSAPATPGFVWNAPPPNCRRCGAPMRQGEAIPPAIVADGAQESEGFHVGSAPLLFVWKCPLCGHSFTIDALGKVEELLHDATEAYLGDVVRPLKITLPDYRELERKTEGVIFAGLQLPPISEETRRVVKLFDDAALMAERRDLITDCGHQWSCKAEPLPDPVECFDPDVARNIFLAAFEYHFRRFSEWLNRALVAFNEQGGKPCQS